MKLCLIIAFISLSLTRVLHAEEPAMFPHPDRIHYDSHGLQIEGKDIFIYSGAFHYFRTPKELWSDRFQKMKDAGLNCVETYVPWNWHERDVPASVDDFSKIDLRELDDWITMAEQFGFYVIIRPGPYICSEWSGGGFPQWLVALKKPAKPLRDQMWLQTDDPVFLAWSKHWYDAVCPVVAKHQITRRAPGQPGVILFQIENEYNRLKLPADIKKSYLQSLVTEARGNGIDVPLFTCWTTQTRNVKSGPLSGIIDFVNAYPRWNIDRSFGGLINTQLKDQPDGPLMSMELQGGWYSAIGGKLSEDQDGIVSVQTQNMTLYALQRGFSLINYYMFVGGTNFDDWASREATTTYDFAAAIGEDGRTGERYQRVRAIAEMLRVHGASLLRSQLVTIDPIISDPKVNVVERRATDGGRYFFVRTEDHDGTHAGTVKIADAGASPIFFDFQLESFGSMIFYIPPDSTDAQHGQWLPRQFAPAAQPREMPARVVITQAQRGIDPLPTKWTSLANGQPIEQFGVFDRHYIYYRIAPPAGKPFTVNRIGDHVISATIADDVLALVNGKILSPTSADRAGITFTMPPDGHEAILLFENVGLHQHTTRDLELHWPIGIQTVTSGSTEIPRQFAVGERERGLAISNADSAVQFDFSPMTVGEETQPKLDGLLNWYRMEFQLSENKDGNNVPLRLHLEAYGNGFIYLNGHCLGRYWQIGPQHDFYLPEPWLSAGSGKKNVIALSLRPVDKGTSIMAASVVPDLQFVE